MEETGQNEQSFLHEENVPHVTGQPKAIELSKFWALLIRVVQYKKMLCG